MCQQLPLDAAGLFCMPADTSSPLQVAEKLLQPEQQLPLMASESMLPLKDPVFARHFVLVQDATCMDDGRCVLHQACKATWLWHGCQRETLSFAQLRCGWPWYCQDGATCWQRALQTHLLSCQVSRPVCPLVVFAAYSMIAFSSCVFLLHIGCPWMPLVMMLCWPVLVCVAGLYRTWPPSATHMVQPTAQCSSCTPTMRAVV